MILFELENSQIITNINVSDLIGPQKLQIVYNGNEGFISPLQMGFTCGIVLGLLHKFGVNISKSEPGALGDIQNMIKFLHWNEILKVAVTSMWFLLFLLTLPISLFIIFGCLLIRFFVLILIRKKHGQHFKGLLEGTDTLWIAEDKTTRSIINVLIILEQKNCISKANDLAAEILLTLRKRLSSRLLGEYVPFPKLFYRIAQEYGYFFWTSDNPCTIEDYVRYMPAPTRKAKQIGMPSFEEAYSDICARPLMCNHTALWELLVVKQYITKKESNNEEKITQIPIIFRIHHSLGDGIALMRLFFETVADKRKPKRDLWEYCSRVRGSITSMQPYSYQPMSAYRRLSTFNFTLNANSIQVPTPKSIGRYLKYLGNMLHLFFQCPEACVNQFLLYPNDKNFLHKTKLSEDKTISWYFEKDEEYLLKSIKKIKGNFEEVRFLDVIFTAFAMSMEKYFVKNGEPTPKSMTFALPIRMEIDDPILKLQNRFSLVLQTIPMSSSSTDKTSAINYSNQLLEMNKHSNQMRKSPCILLNYWVMRKLLPILPIQAIKLLTASPQSTVSASNLMGPEQRARIKGFNIKDLIFWLPNKGTTGISFTILSYGGKLHFGLIADKTLISNQEDAQFILRNISKEIKEMNLSID